MSIPPSESRWLYGIHDPGGEYLMLRAGKPGWVVLSQSIGHDPANKEGADFLRYRIHRLGVICTLNNGTLSDGTIPSSDLYDAFAARCANFVAASRGCSIWIIGSEPNSAAGRPPVAKRSKRSVFPLRLNRHVFPRRRQPLHAGPYNDATLHKASPQAPRTETITPRLYAECYRKCRRAIRAVPGHSADQVIVAAIAPWNTDTRYAGNEWGDWVAYFTDVLHFLDSDGCDGFALHTGTSQADYRLISSSATMNAPYEGRHMEFRAYRDFLESVPDSMRHLPVYITRVNQGEGWQDENTGWIQAAYNEIDSWNRTPSAQTIRTMALWRWDDDDSYSIRNKNRILADFRAALQGDHTWSERRSPPWRKGDRLIALTYIEIHETPLTDDFSRGGADSADVLPPYSALTIEHAAPARSGGHIWWYVRETLPKDDAREGWVAQAALSGETRLRRVREDAAASADDAGSSTGLRPGGMTRTLDIVRMRLTPGFQEKPESDIVIDVPRGALLSVLTGPRITDNIPWWLVRWRLDSASEYTGWMAEYTPAGGRLLSPSSDDADGRPEKRQRFAPGDLAETLTLVRLRRSPGYLDKPASDVVADIWQGTPVKILGGPAFSDDLTWWRVSTVDAADETIRGWMAERAPEGAPLLGKRALEPAPHFEVGDLAVVRYVPVRVRNSPGYREKDDTDVLSEFGPHTTLVIQSGTEYVDELTWWRAGGIARFGDVIGWVAQSTPGGVPLIGLPEPLPGTDMPNPEIGSYLGAPYSGQYGIGQMWGENSAFYRRYSYDGAELLGHNGIDFLLPGGNVVYATEAGATVMAGFEPDGFGWYILLTHAWGESLYAHLREVNVSVGQRVRRGDPIGLSGNSGNSTGPHLHFSIRVFPYDRSDGWGGFSDPLPYLPPSSYLLPNYVLDEQYQMYRSGRRPVFARLEPSGMREDRAGMKRP